MKLVIFCTASKETSNGNGSFGATSVVIIFQHQFQVFKMFISSVVASKIETSLFQGGALTYMHPYVHHAEYLRDTSSVHDIWAHQHQWFNTSLFDMVLVAEQWSLERSSGWAPSNNNKQASAGKVSINKQQKLQQQWQRNKWGQRISTKSPHQQTTATIHNSRNGSIDSQHSQASSIQLSQGCWPKQKHHNKQSQINYLQMAQQHQQKDNCGHDYQHYYSSSWYQQPKQQ